MKLFMVGELMYSVPMIVLANFLMQPNSWNTEVDSVDFMKIRLLKRMSGLQSVVVLVF